MNASKSALLVEDNPDNRIIFHYLLRAQGYAVTEAEDGLTALQLLKRHTYDLMVLDLFLPQLDGGAVLEGIMHNPVHHPMKVIAITAAINWSRMQDAIDARADYFMQKPINIDDFNFALNIAKANRSTAVV